MSQTGHIFLFSCPQCGQSVEADETYRGQVAECPYCGKGIVIPRASISNARVNEKINPVATGQHSDLHFNRVHQKPRLPISDKISRRTPQFAVKKTIVITCLSIITCLLIFFVTRKSSKHHGKPGGGQSEYLSLNENTNVLTEVKSGIISKASAEPLIDSGDSSARNDLNCQTNTVASKPQSRRRRASTVSTNLATHGLATDGTANRKEPKINSHTNGSQEVTKVNPVTKEASVSNSSIITHHGIDPHNPKSGLGIPYTKLAEIQDEAIAKEKQDKTKTLSSFCGVFLGAKLNDTSSPCSFGGKIQLPWGASECANYWNSMRIAYVQYTPETHKIARIRIKPIDNGMGYDDYGGDVRPNKFLQEFLDGLSKKYKTRPYFILPCSKYSLNEAEGEFMFPLGDTSVYIYVSTKHSFIIKYFECVHDKYVELGKTEKERLIAKEKDDRFKMFSNGDFFGVVLGKVYTTSDYDPFYDDGSGYVKFSRDLGWGKPNLECFATCVSKRLVKMVVHWEAGREGFFELCEMTGRKLGTKVTWENPPHTGIYTADVKKGEIEINIRKDSRYPTFTVVHKGMERLARQELRQWERNKDEETKSTIRQKVDSL